MWRSVHSSTGRGFDMNHVVLVVLDSCRWDSLVEADVPTLRHLGPIERRWSYATWTLPSHVNMAQWLLPHLDDQRELAGTTYAREFAAWSDRLGLPRWRRPDGALHTTWLPTHLRELGWHVEAIVSMSVLHPGSVFATGWNRYTKLSDHDDLDAATRMLRFDGDRPRFYLVNTGETHYPYTHAGDPDPGLPRVPGLRAASVDAASDDPSCHAEAAEWLRTADLRALHDRQVESCRRLDAKLGRLLNVCPAGTRVVVTADHGELFGEDGMFGHGPFHHPNLLCVPFVEGTV